MSKWLLDLAQEADDDLAQLHHVIRKRVIEKLGWLQDNFDMVTPLPLGNNWRGFFKLRIGDWRVIYKTDWDKNKITVVVIDHRTKIYKRRSRYAR